MKVDSLVLKTRKKTAFITPMDNNQVVICIINTETYDSISGVLHLYDVVSIFNNVIKRSKITNF